MIRMMDVITPFTTPFGMFTWLMHLYQSCLCGWKTCHLTMVQCVEYL
jgi:hypothetical protein